MTFQEAFDKLKVILLTADTAGFSGHFAIQVNLTNKDCGGIFYIEWKDGALYVEPYDYYDRNVMVSAMAGDLVRILEGRMNPQKALESGKLQIEGDGAVLLAVLGAIKPAPKPARKTTAKKAAVKQEIEKKEPAKKKTAKKAANTPAKTETIEKTVKSSAKKTSKKKES